MQNLKLCVLEQGRRNGFVELCPLLFLVGNLSPKKCFCTSDSNRSLFRNGDSGASQLETALAGIMAGIVIVRQRIRVVAIIVTMINVFEHTPDMFAHRVVRNQRRTLFRQAHTFCRFQHIGKPINERAN